MPNREAEYLFGPGLIGTCIELVLQGVLSTQFVKYFGTYHNDPLILKAMVGILVLLTYLRSMQVFTTIWFQLVVNFGDLEAAMGLITGAPGIWFVDTIGVFASMITVYVQSYFCYRLLIISKNRYLVATLSVLFIACFIFIVIATHYIFQGLEHLTQVAFWFNIYLPVVMVADITLTTSTAYFLIKYKEHVSKQSAGLLDALIRLTIQTAAPATLCALLNFVVALTFPNVYPSARSMASAAPNIVLPKLYAFSMMWTLNARRQLRASLSDTVESTGSLSGRTAITDAEHNPVEMRVGELVIAENCGEDHGNNASEDFLGRGSHDRWRGSKTPQ
ncbi:hypothetical protein DFH07DRAFT_970374 [Mycena maculata]|uniref:DUF6534 domain-containing protein n=1 Tax=Mycena maculata TaxID=230809 RepID=A0AAD7HRV3_9AGAR|nr:hypothetical protein DFH07DRAFT_970374 [Mycena maculata]